jgi:hypothetical protein
MTTPPTPALTRVVMAYRAPVTESPSSSGPGFIGSSVKILRGRRHGRPCRKQVVMLLGRTSWKGILPLLQEHSVGTMSACHILDGGDNHMVGGVELRQLIQPCLRPINSKRFGSA